MNQDFYLNKLSLFELQWYWHHLKDSPGRLSVAEALLKNKKGDFSYREAGFSRHQVHDFIKYFEKTLEEWDAEKALKMVADWNECLMKSQPIDLFGLLIFLERDADLCKERGRFCFPKSEWLRFLLKQAKDHAFVRRDYENMNRLIVLDDFYTPYFQINDEVHSFARKINHAIRFLDWKKLKDIVGITQAYLSKHKQQLCMTTKLVLYRFLIGQHYNENDKNELDWVLDAIFEEQCLQPYSSRMEFDILSLITFFNNYTQTGNYAKAILYYREPNLDLNSSHFQGNIYSYLGIALESYDLVLAEKYITQLTSRTIDEIRPIVLHLIARFYLLKSASEMATPYITEALETLKGKKSYELFFETYSVWFRLLYLKGDYESILSAYQQANVKKMLRKSTEIDMHNFELMLCYLLAKYQVGKLKEETFNEQLYRLIENAGSIVNGFFKLRIIENMQKLLADPSIRLASKNKQIPLRLQKELINYKAISNLDWD